MTMTPDPDTDAHFYDGTPTKRLIAWLIDMAVIACFTLLAVILTAFTGLFILPILFLCISFAYRVITIANGSATWGMRLVSLELRTHDDQRFDLGYALLHTLGYTISVAMPLLQLISVVLMCTTERRQGLTDLVMGTVALNRRS
ncbi:RDD family protein [Sulfitobacter sp. S190]|uniref:RDD family protein n=1 Tax=Sulfitobacter sp. S190 TaxID=2867022 RepID=UPI0021A2D044|nr:RDD family protein [Sulfitobacter sp. S190]UWR20934.1 RDD family protein [Sulfitobacter sp. S190]